MTKILYIYCHLTHLCPPTVKASETLMNSIWKFALSHSCIVIMTDKGTIQRANERVIYISAEKSTIWLMGG